MSGVEFGADHVATARERSKAMGEMADYTLEALHDEDEYQLNLTGHSNVFWGIGRGTQPTVCPHCKTKLITRQGKHGKFLCCPQWPKCQGITWALEAPDNSYAIAEAEGEW